MSTVKKKIIKKIQSQGRRQKQTEPFHAQACPLSSSDAGMWGMLSVHLIHSSALRPGEGLQSPLWLPSQRAAQPGRQEEEEEGVEAHPQRDLLETWPSAGGYRRVLRSDESTNLLRFALFSKGRTRGRGRRCRKEPSRHHHHHHHQPLRWLRRGHRRLPR